MAFCFYLNSEQDWQNFIKYVQNWKCEFSDDYLIGIQDKRQQIDFDIEGEIEDDFEII